MIKLRQMRHLKFFETFTQKAQNDLYVDNFVSTSKNETNETNETWFGTYRFVEQNNSKKARENFSSREVVFYVSNVSFVSISSINTLFLGYSQIWQKMQMSQFFCKCLICLKFQEAVQ